MRSKGIYITLCGNLNEFYKPIKLHLSIHKTTQKFWQTWKEFEIAHGNEDTVREMLRIKRSVQATYNVQVNFMSAQMIGGSGDGMHFKIDPLILAYNDIESRFKCSQKKTRIQWVH